MLITDWYETDDTILQNYLEYQQANKQLQPTTSPETKLLKLTRKLNQNSSITLVHDNHLTEVNIFLLDYKNIFMNPF
jgi:hypothetical protein